MNRRPWSLPAVMLVTGVWLAAAATGAVAGFLADKLLHGPLPAGAVGRLRR